MKIDLLLTVCDLYYNEKMTQAQIATKLNTSRPTISRILDEAREEGIVQITISAPLVINNTLSNQVKKKFNLKNVINFKNTGNYKYDLKNLGKVTAKFVDTTIEKGSILGISWGKAMESFVENMPTNNWNNVKIIQLNGGLGSGGMSKDGSELVINLGQKTNSQYELLSAPAFVDTEQLQSQLFEQWQIKKVIDFGNKFDISVSGIGNLSPEKNTLYNANIINEKDLIELQKKGAVGHIAGRMYDINGKEVFIKDKWPISPSLETFLNTPISIGSVTGKSRANSVLGAINGKLINTLICDEELAKMLLNIKN